jgi:hypothetical protein
MEDESYPKDIRPDHGETLLVGENEVSIPSINLVFSRWRGEPIQYTFGGKPIIDYEGKAMFVELAIMNMAIRNGWSARWVETYGSKSIEPFYFTDWLDAPLRQQGSQPLDSSYHRDLLAKIASQNGGVYLGCWDILAWREQRTLFIESKQYKKDKIRDSQVKWLTSALSVGLEPHNFLIAQWSFDD